MANELLPQSLTDLHADELLKKIGLNELPQAHHESAWHQVVKLLKEPMLLLLIVTSLIYLIMGDLSEGLMLVISAFVVVGISVYQERKSEKALTALRELSSPRALVVRGGVEKRIPATLLVPGDLIALHEGDRVPADGFLLQATNLMVDESLLTGESFPVRKSAALASLDASEFDVMENQLKVYSSTLVTGGKALARVAKTGTQTEVGKIGRSLQSTVPEELNLNHEIRQMVQLFAWSGALICLTIVVFYGYLHGEWLQAVLVGLATQMSLLPEEFPVVLTIFLAMGAWRLSKVQVLVRKPSSIERLGAITALCVDKTGTLTLNQMTVAGLNNSKTTTNIDANSVKLLTEDFHEVVEYAVLASHRDPFDPMEKAIHRLIEAAEWGKPHLHHGWEFLRDYPLSEQLFAMSCVWKDPQIDSYIVAAKGAPEAIASLCHLTAEQAAPLYKEANQMALRGLRVLGVARALYTGQRLPTDQHDFAFQWLGLIGLEDPIRPEVPHAVQQCREAGVRVIMMTGDYPETALQIAERAGIDTKNALITGAELGTLSDENLSERLKTAHIFARMVPEQKLRIVQTLKKLGHVVAMTGDGVNDAPSLKWSDIGIAMGARGTDVAREASDIVLIDDNFASIVSGIERGRMIFCNIKKAIGYIVSIHVPIAGLSIIPVLFNWPLILFPIHIVFLELIIDPTCSLLFESQAVEPETMRSPPRPLHSRLFLWRDLLRSFLQGALALVAVLGVHGYDMQLNLGHATPDHTRALAFVVLTMSNIGLIFADMSGGSIRQLRSLFQNYINWCVVIGVICCLLLITQIEAIRELFHFGRLQIYEFAIASSVAFIVFTIVSVWNWLANKRM